MLLFEGTKLWRIFPPEAAAMLGPSFAHGHDAVFDEESSNESVYRATAAPLIAGLMRSGKSSTCFAYGATGAGKVRVCDTRHCRTRT